MILLGKTEMNEDESVSYSETLQEVIKALELEGKINKIKVRKLENDYFEINGFTVLIEVEEGEMIVKEKEKCMLLVDWLTVRFGKNKVVQKQKRSRSIESKLAILERRKLDLMKK